MTHKQFTLVKQIKDIICDSGLKHIYDDKPLTSIDFQLMQMTDNDQEEAKAGFMPTKFILEFYSTERECLVKKGIYKLSYQQRLLAKACQVMFMSYEDTKYLTTKI